MKRDPFDPADAVTVDRKDVDTIEPAKMSPVPEGLLAPLNEGEVMDLLAYLLSGSNPKPTLFFSLHDNGGHIGIT